MRDDTAFADRIVALLSPLGPVRARRMFGAWGVFHEAVMIGLIANGRLYLKIDAETEEAFAAAGCAPFAYEKAAGRTVVMSYREAPADTLDDPGRLMPWAELALGAATRGAKQKRRKSKR